MTVLQHQFWHLLSLLTLLVGILLLVNKDDSLLLGELGGVSSATWMILAILSPIVHQFYVLVCWRLELHYKCITKAFGANGFKLYKIGFAILILSRLVTIIMLAISNRSTLSIDPVLAYLIAGILLIPSVYLFYSVQKYFGMDRAFGIDHFQPEELKNTPFVKQGMFKYSSNAMYVFGFMILWIPGFLLMSEAAILVAAFNHIYIWVHYYFTELPDMQIIYKE